MVLVHSGLPGILLGILLLAPSTSADLAPVDPTADAFAVLPGRDTTDTGIATRVGSDNGSSPQAGNGTEGETTTNSTTTIEIPVFPTWAGLALAAGVGIGGAFLILRPRL